MANLNPDLKITLQWTAAPRLTEYAQSTKYIISVVLGVLIDGPSDEPAKTQVLKVFVDWPSNWPNKFRVFFEINGSLTPIEVNATISGKLHAPAEANALASALWRKYFLDQGTSPPTFPVVGSQEKSAPEVDNASPIRTNQTAEITDAINNRTGVGLLAHLISAKAKIHGSAEIGDLEKTIAELSFKSRLEALQWETHPSSQNDAKGKSKRPSWWQDRAPSYSKLVKRLTKDSLVAMEERNLQRLAAFPSLTLEEKFRDWVRVLSSADSNIARDECKQIQETHGYNPIDFAQLALFHSRRIRSYAFYDDSEEARRVSDRSKAIDNRVFGFEERLSLLSHHPPLMRRLGLIFDLEIERKDVPEGVCLLWVEPIWLDENKKELPHPPAQDVLTRLLKTRVKKDDTWGLRAEHRKDDGKDQDRPGYLNLDAAKARLEFLDADGAGLKLLQQAGNDKRTLVEQVILRWNSEGRLVYCSGTPGADTLFVSSQTLPYHPLLKHSNACVTLPDCFDTLQTYLAESRKDLSRIWSERRWVPTESEKKKLKQKIPLLEDLIHNDTFKGFLVSVLRNWAGHETGYVIYLSDPEERSVEPQSLVPSNRTAGLSLLFPNQAEEVLRLRNRDQELREQCTCSAELPCLWAEDILMGFVPEVFVTSVNEWRSLTLREESYNLDTGKTVSDETDGIVTLASTHTHDETDSPQGEASVSKDEHVCQSLFRWDGWNLAIPFPSDKKRVKVDGPQDEIKIKHFDHTFPKLRFSSVLSHDGQDGVYRVRLKTVDIAGNYIGMKSSRNNLLVKDDICQAELKDSVYCRSQKFLRAEPVSPPEILLSDALNCESAPTRGLVRCVIHKDDFMEERWIVPPRISARLVEWHGMFDGHESIEELGEFDDVLTKDGAFPTVKTRGYSRKVTETKSGSPDEQPSRLPVRQSPHPVKVGPKPSKNRYYPDPLAMGVAYRLTDSAGHVFPGERMSGFVDFYSLLGRSRDWPKATAFRIRLIGGSKQEGKDYPSPSNDWNNAIRVLTITLPPGMQAKLELSSHFGEEITGSRTRLYGMAAWHTKSAALDQLKSLQEFLKKSNRTVSKSVKVALEKEQSMLEKLLKEEEVLNHALNGRLPVLTPAKVIELVHAVECPLQVPLLVCVDDTPNPPPRKCSIEATSIEGRLVRDRNSTKVTLGLEICADSQTTGEVELHAKWEDVLDDPQKCIDAAACPKGYLPMSHSEVVAKYTVQLANGLNWGIVFPVNQDDVPVIHDFAKGTMPGSGTQYRKVTYWVNANSRFRAEFPFESTHTFSQESLPKMRHVLSSSPPLAPSVAYLVPELGWKLHVDTSEKASPPTLFHTRVGGHLKIYLDRPWFTSGAGEKLGIVLWPFRNGVPDSPRDFVTQWGMDPIFVLDKPFSLLPNANHFPGSVIQEATVIHNGKEWPVELATFEPVFDFEKQMWSCSMQVTPVPSYCTFIRFALVRYQEHSIPGCQVSSVALADFAQLLPDRSVSIVRDATDCRMLNVKVIGNLNNPERTVSIVVKKEDRAVTLPGNCYTVKIHKPMALTDNGGIVWMEDTSFTITTKTPAGQKDVLWNGTITWPSRPCGKRRLVVMEYEWHLAVIDNDPGYEPKPRLVYNDVLEV